MDTRLQATVVNRQKLATRPSYSLSSVQRVPGTRHENSRAPPPGLSPVASRQCDLQAKKQRQWARPGPLLEQKRCAPAPVPIALAFLLLSISAAEKIYRKCNATWRGALWCGLGTISGQLVASLDINFVTNLVPTLGTRLLRHKCLFKPRRLSSQRSVTLFSCEYHFERNPRLTCPWSTLPYHVAISRRVAQEEVRASRVLSAWQQFCSVWSAFGLIWAKKLSRIQRLSRLAK